VRRLVFVWSMLSVACVLFTTPFRGDEHCGFAGREKLCGECLATRCAGAIDTCCSETSCDGAILSVEQCARTQDQSCAELLRPSTNKERLALATCARDNCAAYCSPATGTSVTACGDTPLTAGFGCRCRTGSNVVANNYVCSEASLPRTRCCAPQAWPGPTVECTCKPFACFPTSEGCVCNLGSSAEPGDLLFCRGAHCCATDTVCTCQPSACSPGTREVAECNLQQIGCATATRAVPSCSISE
jgi:hypothetical protein